MADSDFDPILYNRPPVVNVASGFALGHALLTALPKDPPELVLRSAIVLRTALVALQSAWIDQTKTTETTDRRVADKGSDNSWSALEARVMAYTLLPPESYPLVRRAMHIHQRLFAQGLAFLTYKYDEQWAEAQKRLDIIDKEGLAADLEVIAGKEFVDNVRAAQVTYGKAVHTTEAATAAPEIKLDAPLRDLQNAIGRYGRQWAALAEDGPELQAAAKGALAPIDRLRERQAAGAQPGEQPEQPPEQPVVDPTTPVPIVPDHG